jgi:hypothetical protein
MAAAADTSAADNAAIDPARPAATVAVDADPTPALAAEGDLAVDDREAEDPEAVVQAEDAPVAEDRPEAKADLAAAVVATAVEVGAHSDRAKTAGALIVPSSAPCDCPSQTLSIKMMRF